MLYHDKFDVEKLFGVFFTLVLIGYPIAGMAAIVADVPSWIATYPFRVMIGGMAVLLYITSIKYKNNMKRSYLLILFISIYYVRLFIDWINIVPNTIHDAYYMFITIIIPLLSLRFSLFYWNDSKIQKSILITGTIICCSTLALGAIQLNMSSSHFSQTGRLFFDGVNPITIGHVAVTTIISLVLYAGDDINGNRKFYIIIPCLAAITCLILAAARGPLVSLLICVIIHSIIKRNTKFILSMTFGFILVSIFVSINELVLRIQNFKNDESVIERWQLINDGIRDFIVSPIFGAAHNIVHRLDINIGSSIEQNASYNYPHNLFVESLMSTGILGTSLLLITLYEVFKYLYKDYMRRNSSLITLLWVQYFIAFQFSGAIWNSAAFWICLQIICDKKNNEVV